jgi:hypothetical protein
VPQTSSSANQSIPQPYSNHEAAPSQSPDEKGIRLKDADVPTEFFETGDLDVEFSRSFIPEITSIFDEASLPWDNGGLTAQQPFLGHGMTISYQPAPIDITDMTNFCFVELQRDWHVLR